MKTPKSFEVMGQTIRVKRIDNLTDEQGATGLCKIMKGVIEVQKKTPSFSNDYVDITLRHEIVHAWLSSLGEHELNVNEKFVDALANLWHQFDKTKKY